MKNLFVLVFVLLLSSCGSRKNVKKEYLYVLENHKFYFPDEDGIAPEVTVKAAKLTKVDRNNFIIMPYNEGADVEITIKTSRRTTKRYEVQYIPMPELIIWAGKKTVSSRSDRTISVNDLKSNKQFALAPVLSSFHHDCIFKLERFDIMLVSAGNDEKKMTNVTSPHQCNRLFLNCKKGDILVISNVFAIHQESGNVIQCSDLVLEVTE